MQESWYKNMKVYIVRHGQVPHNTLKQYNNQNEDYENVLIVAHSGVSKAFSGYFEGIQDGKFLNRGLKNCEIKEYELN